MKFYVIAGEASGDLHGSNLIASIKDQYPTAQFRVWGGDKMENEGATLVKHYKDLAFMGFAEVAKNLKTILGNIAFCKEDIAEYNPDAIILIDYPGFNLRIAKWAHQFKTKKPDLKIIYYISPQIWAWNTKRVHKIKKLVDQMITIIPFEKAFYADYGMDVIYAGHPLIDEHKKFSADDNFKSIHALENHRILLLMPGSRKQEIKKMLPIMLEASSNLPNYKLAIAALNSIGKPFYENIIGGKNISLIFENNYQLLNVCDLAWISSGTASLEAAIFGVPHIVCYKGNAISYQIAKRLVKIKYISLVNLIADQDVVPELIQDELTTKNLLSQTEKILGSTKRILDLYQHKVVSKLGDGNASSKAAKSILDYLKPY